ncbi:MAG: CopG family transcriptional regulator [Deltaproteobacteria bacterium]|nr:CopG family transcriptional regulator [Deltaproteobacteria bacterium]
MSRLTISLDDDLQQALREAAARSGTSMNAIIADALRLWGVNPSREVEAILTQARGRTAGPDDAALLELAVTEARSHRRGRSKS